MKYMIYCKIENERISFESLAGNYPIMVARLKQKYDIENGFALSKDGFFGNFLF